MLLRPSSYRLFVLTIFLLLGLASLSEHTTALFGRRGRVNLPCRFAPLFTREQLLTDPHKREQFINAVLCAEARFTQPGIGYSEKWGFAYDGHGIDQQTGALADPLHYWSAPSKEAIHVGILALAVSGRIKRAEYFMNCAAGGNNGTQLALNLLAQKMDTYEKWNATYPGYGGYFPWVFVYDEGMVPANGWDNQVPALDNGEWVWSLIAAQWALAHSGHTVLAARYARYIDMLAANSLMIFYAGDGHIRCVTKITNISAAPYPDNYQDNGGEPCWLDDPYEGELFAVFLDLYAPWKNPADREQIWIAKRAKLQSVEYTTPQGRITCQRGWWFSAHEQWKYLELPYVDVDINRRVFLNGERARTWNSALTHVPGLFASVNDVSKTNSIPDYISATGIQSLAFQPILNADVVTPYGSMPVWLAGGEAIGSVWYHVMLSGARMQGPYGSTEASNVTGTAISPVVTWDSKITTVLAIMGGIVPLTREVLQATDKYQRFTTVINREWSRVFPSLSGESLGFALPSEDLPQHLAAFSLCPSSPAYEGKDSSILGGWWLN